MRAMQSFQGKNLQEISNLLKENYFNAVKYFFHRLFSFSFLELLQFIEIAQQKHFVYFSSL